MTEFFLKTASLLYFFLAEVKNRFYDLGLLDSVRVGPKVISVGNLTVGGTGKTPIVDLILEHFKQGSLAACLISRNYKAQIRFTSVIDLQKKNGAAYFGDEAWMLAAKHPEALVFVGPQKWYSLWLAGKEKDLKVCVVDDGFQHRALARDLDIVLLDCTAPLADYELLPLGRARESWRALQRAQIIILTKSNLAPQGQLESLRHKLDLSKLSALIVEARVDIDLSAIVDSVSGARPEIDIPRTRVVAFAGVAHPEQFEKMIRDSGQVELIQFISFSDHHVYSSADLKEIAKQAEGADLLLTTEKDFVKLCPQDFSLPLRAVPLTTKMSHHAVEFYAALDSLFC